VRCQHADDLGVVLFAMQSSGVSSLTSYSLDGHDDGLLKQAFGVVQTHHVVPVHLRRGR